MPPFEALYLPSSDLDRPVEEATLKGLNMDEYILWTAEDSKAGVGALTSSAMESNTAIRQNNIPKPAALHDRTAEDFWKDIQKESTTDVAEPDMLHQQQQRQAQPPYPRQRQAPIGEMTLADFLVRTGIVTDDPDAGPQTAESSSFCPSTSSASIVNGFSSSVDAFPSLPTRECMNFHHHHLQHQQMLQHTESAAAANRTFEPSSMLLTTNSPIYDGLVDNTALVPDGFANTLALSPSFSDYSLPSTKRFSSTVPEKSMERRQKRMIKNRESAARSRARKQAYTVELETEVSLLKKENALLKLQQALQARPPELARMQNSKMYVLRRTQSL